MSDAEYEQAIKKAMDNAMFIGSSPSYVECPSYCKTNGVIDIAKVSEKFKINDGWVAVDNERLVIKNPVIKLIIFK